MVTLFLLWLTGGVLSLGLLSGISYVEKTKTDNYSKFIIFIKSWYSFGFMLGITIAEIGKFLTEKR